MTAFTTLYEESLESRQPGLLRARASSCASTAYAAAKECRARRDGGGLPRRHHINRRVRNHRQQLGRFGRSAANTSDRKLLRSSDRARTCSRCSILAKPRWSWRWVMSATCRRWCTRHSRAWIRPFRIPGRQSCRCAAQHSATVPQEEVFQRLDQPDAQQHCAGVQQPARQGHAAHPVSLAGCGQSDRMRFRSTS